MVLNIVSLFCVILVSVALGIFINSVIINIVHLKAIKTKTDSIPQKYLGMTIYMDNIPQNEQNILNLGSVPVKIYERGEYSDLPVPYIGAEVGGIYYNGRQKFSMVGIVSNIHYNTDLDLIVVSCKCTEIRKI
jgi:hypothetical protein